MPCPTFCAVCARLAAESGWAADIDLSRVVVEPPRDAAHGDMATNAAMVLAKEAKAKPRDLAEQIASRLRADELIASGIDAITPCVAVSKASTPDQRVHRTTLAALEDDAVGPAPVLLLIGHAIR